MASKYLQTFPIPQDFHSILEDFSREILREQPTNLVEFGALYFKAKEANKPFEWDPRKSAMPKPADYPRIQGAVDPTPQSRGEYRGGVTSVMSEKSLGARSIQSSCSERAKEYVNDVVERVFDKVYNERI